MTTEQASLSGAGAGLDGRALDLELARVLFGWKPFQLDDGWWYYIPSGKPRRTHMIDARPVPRYAETWEGLGLVVERMRARGYAVTLRSTYPDGWRCEVSRLPRLWHADAEIAPHAVALAALAAVRAAGEGA